MKIGTTSFSVLFSKPLLVSLNQSRRKKTGRYGSVSASGEFSRQNTARPTTYFLVADNFADMLDGTEKWKQPELGFQCCVEEAKSNRQ
jgi:hypothetical protein